MSHYDQRLAGTRDYHGSEEGMRASLRRRLVETFGDYGYLPVEPPILEQASLFLDRSGEEIRQRMYVFFDPGGREICLRPELTIPTCRLYLRELASQGRETRLSYNGPVFRYESPKAGRYRQFLQAGVECIGATEREASDAEVLGLALDAVGRAGLANVDVHIGDLDLLGDFIDGLSLGRRWKERLRRYMWRLAFFRDQLRAPTQVTSPQSTPRHDRFLDALSSLGRDRSRLLVEEVLALADIQRVGERTPDEIISRLLGRAEEMDSEPLSPEVIAQLETLLAIRGRPEDCLKAMEEHARISRVSTMGPVLDRFASRLELFEAFGLDTASMTLDVGLRRGLEYYTGFVFEIHVPNLNLSQVCGGGRYDTLIEQLGGPADTPAVGFALGLERLQMALMSQDDDRGTTLPRLDAVVVAAGDVNISACARVASALRGGGWAVRMDLCDRRPRSVLTHALREGVQHVVFVGEDEIGRGEVRIKNLEQHTEEVVPVDNLSTFAQSTSSEDQHDERTVGVVGSGRT